MCVQEDLPGAASSNNRHVLILRTDDDDEATGVRAARRCRGLLAADFPLSQLEIVRSERRPPLLAPSTEPRLLAPVHRPCVAERAVMSVRM